jgi:hypothetical protein
MGYLGQCETLKSRLGTDASFRFHPDEREANLRSRGGSRLNQAVPCGGEAGVIQDWFERLMGFAEGGYEDTRSRLEVEGRELRLMGAATV